MWPNYSSVGSFRSRRILRCEQLEPRDTPAVFTVNATYDAIDANLGDGLARDAAGKTTLRAAIDEGNFGTGATIDFDATTFATTKVITQTLGQLTLEKNFTINGTTPNISLIPAYDAEAPATWRLIEVRGTSTSTFNHITLSNAFETNGSGGGILNKGDLTLNDCIVTNCKATNGGGIANNLKLTANRCSLSNNRAPLSDGGGLYCAPNLNCVATLTDSVIAENNASKGGGLAVLPGAQLNLINSTVFHNVATGQGGGIYTDGTFSMIGTASILKNNSAVDGGGIYVSGGVATVTDTTVESNAASGWGGGVWAKNGSITILTRCAFVTNSATVGGPKIAYTGNNPDIVTLDNCSGVTNADRKLVV